VVLGWGVKTDLVNQIRGHLFSMVLPILEVCFGFEFSAFSVRLMSLRAACCRLGLELWRIKLTFVGTKCIFFASVTAGRPAHIYTPVRLKIQALGCFFCCLSPGQLGVMP